MNSDASDSDYSFFSSQNTNTNKEDELYSSKLRNRSTLKKPIKFLGLDDVRKTPNKKRRKLIKRKMVKEEKEKKKEDESFLKKKRLRVKEKVEYVPDFTDEDILQHEDDIFEEALKITSVKNRYDAQLEEDKKEKKELAEQIETIINNFIKYQKKTFRLKSEEYVTIYINLIKMYHKLINSEQFYNIRNNNDIFFGEIDDEYFINNPKEYINPVVQRKLYYQMLYMKLCAWYNALTGEIKEEKEEKADEDDASKRSKSSSLSSIISESEEKDDFEEIVGVGGRCDDEDYEE